MSYASAALPPARIRPLAEADASASPSASPEKDVSVVSGVRPVRAGPARARRATALTVVGYIERVALPGWGLVGLPAKIDTGAETCALHVENARMVGATRIAFEVAATDEDEPLVVEARIVRRGLVRSSNGHTEERVFVRTSLTLGGRSQSVEVGLVDRSQMEYRMLVGRSALAGTFLVDPSRLSI